jgi:hypothetical protein
VWLSEHDKSGKKKLSASRKQGAPDKCKFHNIVFNLGRRGFTDISFDSSNKLFGNVFFSAKDTRKRISQKVFA